MKLWLTCREVSEAAASGEALSPLARVHLAVCAACRRFRRQLAAIAQALRERVFEEPEGARVDALRRAVLARLKP